MEEAAPPIIAIIIMMLAPVGVYTLVKWIYLKYKYRKDMKRLKKFNEHYSDRMIVEIRPFIARKTTLQKYCNHERKEKLE